MTRDQARATLAGIVLGWIVVILIAGVAAYFHI